VLATSRRYREVEPLARSVGLDLTYVGERGGKGPEAQLVAATRRQAELIPIVKSFGPAASVSTASAVCARISFGLRVKHVAVNDSPHSEVAARLALPLSHHLLCPWVIPYKAWAKYGVSRSQVSTYHALDPAAWLKRKSGGRGPVPLLDRKRKTVTVRLPESDAPYMTGASQTWADDTLETVQEDFPEANLVALCRYDHQVQDIRKKFGSRYLVPDEVVDGQALLSLTDLFVGMGGTMNAEAALMGVPTISAFQGTLYTERYLRSVGLLERASTTKALTRAAKKLTSPGFRHRLARKAGKVLESMEDPVLRIADYVTTLKQG
jgi:uncharacterized protein